VLCNIYIFFKHTRYDGTSRVFYRDSN